MNGLKLIWKNAARKKLRLFLTVFSIFTAFLIYGVLAGFQSSLDEGIDVASGANRLVTVHKVSFIQPLPFSYVNKVKAMDGVADVTYAAWFGGYYQDPKQILAMFAVDPESYLRLYSELVMPDDVRKTFFTDRRSLLVGKKMADRFGWEKGQQIPINSNIWTNQDGTQSWEFTVAGIFEANDPKIDTSYLLFPYDYFNEGRQFGKGTVGWLVVGTDSPDINTEVADAIDLEFINSSTQTKTDTEKAFNQAFIDQFGDIGLMVALVTGAGFFTILLIAGNTMMLAIRERTSEIAVLKTLGFGNGRLFTQIILESVLVTLMGAIPAMAVASLFLTGASAAMAGFLPEMFINSKMLAQSVGIMAAMALITGILPAWKAMRINVVTALGRK